MWQLEIQMLKYHDIAILWVPRPVEVSADLASVFLYQSKSLNQHYAF
jgi:hypothetical protein